MSSRISIKPTRAARRRSHIALAAGTLAVIAAAATAALSSATFAPQAGQRIDMKVLLLANTAGDADATAWEDSLKREGTPYDRINATPLSAATLADGDRAKYQAVITSGANGTLASGRPDGFSDADWALLRAFEAKFGIRQLNVNAVPGPPLGTTFATATGQLDGVRGSLTATGLTQFPNLAGVVPFDNIDPAVNEVFGFGAAGCNAADATCAGTSYESLLQGGAGTTFAGTSLLGVAKMKDDREEMTASFSGNQFQTHSQVLRHALLSWVTGGVFIGRDRSYLSVDVDDIFLPDDKWDPTANATPEGAVVGQQDLRMTPGDVQTLINFQNSKGVKFNMVFNGSGVAEAQAANAGVDTLFNALMASKAQFPWINHTFTHAVLGAPNPGTPPTQATIESEINQNIQFAQANALPNFNATELISGEHSGIGTSNPVVAANPAMAPALNATGITTIAADNSREIGQRQIGGALTLPRYPMNVFYNVSTWADQLDEYDWLYLASTAAPPLRGNCANSSTTTCFTTPVTQAQFVDREASAVVRHMLGNDPRPHYAHQTNLMSESTNANVANRGEGILYAVIGEAVDRYRSYFSVPILQPGMTALKDQLRRQIAWGSTSNAQVNGYIQDGKVNIVSTVARDVPITGTTTGDVYGGQRSAWLAVNSGTTTLDLEEPHNTVAPAISGQNRVGATLTATDGTFTGTPAPAITSRQWQRRTPGSPTGPWSAIAGATTATYVVTAADQGRELRFVTTAANRHATWGMGLSAPFPIPGPILVPDPQAKTTPPAGNALASNPAPANNTPAAGNTPAAKGSAVARPAFSCKVTRGRQLIVSCKVRDTSGRPKTARIRAVRGKQHVVGRASGRVRNGNQVPILRMKRTGRRYDTRITIVVTLASGKTRTMARTLKL
jgi:hypothetical protein